MHCREVIDACPVCGATGILWQDNGGRYWVECVGSHDCARTRRLESIEDAIRSWNDGLVYYGRDK